MAAGRRSDGPPPLHCGTVRCVGGPSPFLTFPRKGGRDPKGCGRVARVGPDARAPSAASAADVGSASALELTPSLYGFLPPLRGKVRKGGTERRLRSRPPSPPSSAAATCSNCSVGDRDHFFVGTILLRYGVQAGTLHIAGASAALALNVLALLGPRAAPAVELQYSAPSPNDRLVSAWTLGLSGMMLTGPCRPRTMALIFRTLPLFLIRAILTGPYRALASVYLKP